MRLPDDIEREIKRLEAEIDQRAGQHAGNARLWDLRHAIEFYLKRNKLRFDSGLIKESV